MDPVQSSPPRPDDRRERAITELIDAVAEQQEALARILESEHRKIDRAIQMTSADVDDLVQIDDSVARILAAITRLELALQLKLDLFRDCLCPEEWCHGCRTTCGQ